MLIVYCPFTFEQFQKSAESVNGQPYHERRTGNPKNKDELVSLERQHKNLVDKKGQLEEEVDLLKCESNSRSLWLKNMLEMDRGAIARIKDMQNNAEQDLKLMTGKLKLAEVEAVELSEKLKEKEIPKI